MTTVGLSASPPFFVSEDSNQSRGGRKPRDEKERNSSSPLSWEYVVVYGRFELGIKTRRALG